MRAILAGLLGSLLPGLGHLVVGRPRRALLFALPVAAGALALALWIALSGVWALLAVLASPDGLALALLVSVIVGLWRLAAAADAIGATAPSGRATIGAVAVLLVTIAIPHGLAAAWLSELDEAMSATFARTTAPPSSPPPSPSPSPSPALAIAAGPPLPTPLPSPTFAPFPVGVFPSNIAAEPYPALDAAVPWAIPDPAQPWGDDGHYTLLLLGSDAGVGRSGRRTDVMLVLDVNVETGKVSMIGLPRNLENAPFPPGKARDYYGCGCQSEMLNATYASGAYWGPALWPGDDPVLKGLGATRAVIGELTGRPIDSLLIVDLEGVIRVVDALGGVEMDVPYEIYDSRYPDPGRKTGPLHIKAGKQHMDGRLFLAYARSRHQDSDYGRMGRQQSLLIALRSQITPATLFGVASLFAAAKGAAWTDIRYAALPKLVELFGRVSSANAPVGQLRIVPPGYPLLLSSDSINRIRTDVAKLIGIPAPPLIELKGPPPVDATPKPKPSSTPDPNAGWESPSPSPSGVPEPIPPSPTPPAPSPTPPAPSPTPPEPSPSPAP